MALICVPVFVGTADAVSNALALSEAARVAGAQMVEWRVDGLIDGGGYEGALRRLVRDSPLPCVVTCRSEAEGGLFGGDDRALAEFVNVLDHADEQPRYVDVEFAAYERSEHLQAAVDQLHGNSDSARDTGVILSAHDCTGRPDDLTRRVERMGLIESCDVIKVAWRARSLRDNLEAFELLSRRPKPMIALCMGEFGLMSRVLAGKFGGLLTFAALDRDSESAPGQPTVDELKRVYRFDSVSRATSVFGVIGWPVGHSQSPAFHNERFAEQSVDAVYLPLPVADDWVHFKATVGALVDERALDFRGASVTLPHKENLLRFVRDAGGPMDDASARIGAANTLLVSATGAVSCANTDAPAAVEAVCETAGVSPAELIGKKVAIMGAGGVARAVAVGFAEIGANVIIFNRSQERARALAAMLDALGLPGKVVPGKAGRIGCACWDVLVNCTSIGMAGGPMPNGSPLDVLGGPGATQEAVGEGTIVFDTVYTPRRTVLLEAAEALGARIVSGETMFLKQAHRQFAMWAGG